MGRGEDSLASTQAQTGTLSQNGMPGQRLLDTEGATHSRQPFPGVSRLVVRDQDDYRACSGKIGRIFDGLLLPWIDNVVWRRQGRIHSP
jgi:hypothetical protein